MMGNHFSGNILGQLGRADVPWLFSTIRSLTGDGTLPMLALIFGGLAVAIGDWLILRWVGKRDQMFAPLPASHLFRLVMRANSRAGFMRLGAAERYIRLRRNVYFAGWRAQRAGVPPTVSPGDFGQLRELWDSAASPQPEAAPEG